MFKEICRFQSYSNSGCRSRKHTDHLTTTTAHGHANLTYSVTICFILPCKEMFFLYLCLSLHIPFINFNLYNLSCLPIISIKIISWDLLLLTSKSYLPTTCFSLSICLYIFPHSHTHTLYHIHNILAGALKFGNKFDQNQFWVANLPKLWCSKNNFMRQSLLFSCLHSQKTKLSCSCGINKRHKTSLLLLLRCKIKLILWICVCIHPKFRLKKQAEIANVLDRGCQAYRLDECCHVTINQCDQIGRYFGLWATF